MVPVTDSTLPPTTGSTAPPTTQSTAPPSTVASTGWVVAYLYMNDQPLAKEYAILLKEHGIDTKSISMSSAGVTDYTDFDVVIVGPDTIEDFSAVTSGEWGDKRAVARLVGSKVPVLGIEAGGLALFGNLGLAIGGGNAWHGDTTAIMVANAQHPAFQTPTRFTARFVQVYSDVEGMASAAIYMPKPPANATLIGREAGTDDLHYTIVSQDRYLFWGYRPGPTSMTDQGQALFVNIVSYLAKLPR